jgi:hypothetical protein
MKNGMAYQYRSEENEMKNINNGNINMKAKGKQ